MQSYSHYPQCNSCEVQTPYGQHSAIATLHCIHWTHIRMLNTYSYTPCALSQARVLIKHRKSRNQRDSSLCIGASTQPSHTGVNHANAHLQCCQDVGQRLTIPAGRTRTAAHTRDLEQAMQV